MENNQGIEKVKSSGDVPHFGTVNFKDFAELMNFANKIAESKLTPLKKGEDVLAAILYGKELGLEPMTSVNNIYPINGKATLGVHLINALLLKAGVVTEVLNDYEPCVPFALMEDGIVVYKDARGTNVKTDERGKPVDPLAKPVIVRIDYLSSEAKPYEKKGTNIVDFRITKKFTRQVKQLDNTFKEMVVIYSFGNSDAVKAGLLNNSEKPKDNWQNWTKQMCDARCSTFGGRMIGADILMGMMEFTEMADVSGIKYTMTEEGEAIIIPNEKEEVKTSNKNNSETLQDTVTQGKA